MTPPHRARRNIISVLYSKPLVSSIFYQPNWLLKAFKTAIRGVSLQSPSWNLMTWQFFKRDFCPSIKYYLSFSNLKIASTCKNGQSLTKFKPWQNFFFSSVDAKPIRVFQVVVVVVGVWVFFICWTLVISAIFWHFNDASLWPIVID